MASSIQQALWFRSRCTGVITTVIVCTHRLVNNALQQNGIIFQELNERCQNITGVSGQLLESYVLSSSRTQQIQGSSPLVWRINDHVPHRL